jgi:hypothetical protein
MNVTVLSSLGDVLARVEPHELVAHPYKVVKPHVYSRPGSGDFVLLFSTCMPTCSITRHI